MASGSRDEMIPDEGFPEDDVDPEKLQVCEYWRCGDMFEQRTANQRFCRKACRSRHHKWTRAQARKERKAQAKRERAELSAARREPVVPEEPVVFEAPIVSEEPDGPEWTDDW